MTPIKAAAEPSSWHIGTMNDGLFIINAPSRPSNDDVWHERPDGPTVILNVTELPAEKAVKIVEVMNRISGLASPSPIPEAPGVREETDAAGLEEIIADLRREKLDLHTALKSISSQCGNVIYNCEQRPADNQRHLDSWRGCEGVRRLRPQATGRRGVRAMSEPFVKDQAHRERIEKGEREFLEDNIATVSFHLGQPGARLTVSHDGPGLVVDPGEVLKEISRRLGGVAQRAGDCGAWQPIETAPRDGNRFLGWCVFPAGAEPRFVVWTMGGFYAYGCQQDVTHWLPGVDTPPLSSTSRECATCGGLGRIPHESGGYGINCPSCTLSSTDRATP
jgi:hypothetical protein